VIEVNATNGSERNTISDVERDLGTNMYQAVAAVPTLLQLGEQGQVLWQKSASSIFGAANDNPDSGWNIDPIGALDVGSLGPSTVPKTSYDIGDSTTTGFSIATGSPVWTDPGLYNCEGELEIFTTPTICRFTGTVTRTSSGKSTTAGVTVSVEGFNPQTGKVTWTQPDQNVAPLLGNGNIPFIDGDHIVIRQDGSDVILDLTDGEVGQIAPGEVFWCATSPLAQVLAPTGSDFPNERVGMDQFFGCNANGMAESTHPPSQPSMVGVAVGGEFFWPTPHGVDEATAG
jgi:hypothetical protein